MTSLSHSFEYKKFNSLLAGYVSWNGGNMVSVGLSAINVKTARRAYEETAIAKHNKLEFTMKDKHV